MQIQYSKVRLLGKHVCEISAIQAQDGIIIEKRQYKGYPVE